MLERIFEPYVTTKPKGTGLGLAIVKKIVDEHGGAVTIANAKPRGVRVEIVLPQRVEQLVGLGPERLLGQTRTERDLDI
jgi:nitrogen fixation/metabolism regulation signal transduction histidine kinase